MLCGPMPASHVFLQTQASISKCSVGARVTSIVVRNSVDWRVETLLAGETAQLLTPGEA